MAYATAQQLRDQVDVQRDVADPVLEDLLEAATELIDRFCRRPDGFIADAAPSDREYSGAAQHFLMIDECVEIVSVSIDGDAVDPADWRGFRGSGRKPSFHPPFHGVMLGWGDRFPRTRRFPNVTVAARWGYADELPANVHQATITQASRWWMRGRIGWADTTEPPEGGSIQYRKVLDPDVELMLTRVGMVRKIV
jgi:hypothetical protein